MINEGDMRTWSWLEMVAQLDDESMEFVVEGGDPGRGLTGCEIKLQKNSYGHPRQVRKPKAPQLREWDFVFKRDDGTAVRLHPRGAHRK